MRNFVSVVFLAFVLYSTATMAIKARRSSEEKQSSRSRGRRAATDVSLKAPTSLSLVDPSVCENLVRYHQSPVNLGDPANLPQVSFPEWSMQGYDDERLGQRMCNDGESIAMQLVNAATISGGGLVHKYRLQQLHFHWGSDDSKGSEHWLRGKQYPLEMHIVHYNAKHPDFASAVKSKETDALAILGVLFHVQEEDNEVLQPFVEACLDMSNSVCPTPSSQTCSTVSAFQLQRLLPSSNTFYRYVGSLTTNPFSETAVWTVFDTSLGVSHRQLEALRELRDDHCGKLVDNYRQPQPINGRLVLHARVTPDSDCASTTATSDGEEGVSSTTEGAISTTEGAISTTEGAISTTEGARSTTDGASSTTEGTTSTTERARSTTEGASSPSRDSTHRNSSGFRSRMWQEHNYNGLHWYYEADNRKQRKTRLSFRRADPADLLLKFKTAGVSSLPPVEGA